MRKQIGKVVRKAGNALNDFDKAYASKFERDAKGPIDGIGMYGRAVPLSEAFNSIPVNDYEAFGGQGPRTRAEHRVGNAVGSVVFTGNLASRYLLPAGGLTLAGKGLYDLTVGFGSQADQPQPSELRLQ